MLAQQTHSWMQCLKHHAPSFSAAIPPTRDSGSFPESLFFFLSRQEVPEHLPRTQPCSEKDKYRMLRVPFPNLGLLGTAVSSAKAWVGCSCSREEPLAPWTLSGSVWTLEVSSPGQSQAATCPQRPSGGWEKAIPSDRYPAEGRHKMSLRVIENQFTLFPCSQKMKLIFHFSAYVKPN